MRKLRSIQNPLMRFFFMQTYFPLLLFWSGLVTNRELYAFKKLSVGR